MTIAGSNSPPPPPGGWMCAFTFVTGSIGIRAMPAENVSPPASDGAQTAVCHLPFGPSISLSDYPIVLQITLGTLRFYDGGVPTDKVYMSTGPAVVTILDIPRDVSVCPNFVVVSDTSEVSIFASGLFDVPTLVCRVGDDIFPASYVSPSLVTCTVTWLGASGYWDLAVSNDGVAFTAFQGQFAVYGNPRALRLLNLSSSRCSSIISRCWPTLATTPSAGRRRAEHLSDQRIGYDPVASLQPPVCVAADVLPGICSSSCSCPSSSCPSAWRTSSSGGGWRGSDWVPRASMEHLPHRLTPLPSAFLFLPLSPDGKCFALSLLPTSKKKFFFSHFSSPFSSGHRSTTHLPHSIHILSLPPFFLFGRHNNLTPLICAASVFKSLPSSISFARVPTHPSRLRQR